VYKALKYDAVNPSHNRMNIQTLNKIRRKRPNMDMSIILPQKISHVDRFHLDSSPKNGLLYRLLWFI